LCYCLSGQSKLLNPVEVGELVTMKASVNYIGNSSMVVGIRVESENIHTGDKKHCNSSYFTMVAVDDTGKTARVPGLILKTKIDAKRFIKAVKRREGEKQKKQDLNQIYKDIEPYLDQLQDYRVKVMF
jgi:acyl-CoA hydrolase